MKRNVLVMSLALATLAGLQLSVAAEVGKWSVGLHPGYAMPVGSTGDFSKGSFALQASADYQFHEMFSGGLELGYNFGHKVEGSFTDEGTTFDFTSDLKAKILQVTPTFKVSKSMEAGSVNWTPYGVLGLGIYHTSGADGNLTITAPAQFAGAQVRTGEDGAGIDFGFNIGAGLGVAVSDNLSLGVDVRFHDIIANDDSPTQYITPSARLTYSF